jgi:hypothetical protein
MIDEPQVGAILHPNMWCSPLKLITLYVGKHEKFLFIYLFIFYLFLFISVLQVHVHHEFQPPGRRRECNGLQE